MEYDQFVLKAKENNSVRYGQSLIDLLLEVRPELARTLVNSFLDPFYCEDPNDQRIKSFCEYVCANWNWLD